MRKSRSVVIVALALFASASLLWAAGPPTRTESMKRAEAVIHPDYVKAHTRFLSHDLLEGRAPGTRGGRLAAHYIAAQFRRLNLKPGGEDGSYFQKVPLVGKTVDPATAKLAVTRADRSESFAYPEDFVAYTDLASERVAVTGDLVFVGYGVVAPEYDWDDFKGVDVKGKVLLALVNDPPATESEPQLFGGKALTYYGRWTYKYEEAARQGAAGVILIHTTESAGYPYKVVRSSWSGEQVDLPRGPEAPPPLLLKAWVSRAAAEQILALAGESLPALQQAAARRDFRPRPLELQAVAQFQQSVRRLESANVIGILPGGDEKYRNEYVVYTAHYDHLGVGEPDETGDRIYNGAYDNATGVAALLGIAEAMTRLAHEEGGVLERYLSQQKAAARSQVFLAVTAEESGLLGSEYYARHPAVPLARTVANVNIDGLNTWGPTEDIVSIGNGKSELDEVARIVSRDRGVRLRADQHPEQGYFYRSDQFSLAKRGVPALYFDPGFDVRGKPEGYGEERFQEYVSKHYHQASDEIRPGWNWAGAEQMARFLYHVGWVLANWPRDFEWYENAEFRAARQESLREAGLLGEE